MTTDYRDLPVVERWQVPSGYRVLLCTDWHGTLAHAINPLGETIATSRGDNCLLAVLFSCLQAESERIRTQAQEVEYLLASRMERPAPGSMEDQLAESLAYYERHWPVTLAQKRQATYKDVLDLTHAVASPVKVSAEATPRSMLDLDSCVINYDYFIEHLPGLTEEHLEEIVMYLDAKNERQSANRDVLAYLEGV